MLCNLDFSSWHSLLVTLIGLALFTLISIGIRLVMMHPAAQGVGERQINERLKTLIAAYKTLGGSFTGNLTVGPTHLRDLRRPAPTSGQEAAAPLDEGIIASSERSRRIRDDVDAALSDIMLLGTTCSDFKPIRLRFPRDFRTGLGKHAER